MIAYCFMMIRYNAQASYPMDVFAMWIRINKIAHEQKGLRSMVPWVTTGFDGPTTSTQTLAQAVHMLVGGCTGFAVFATAEDGDWDSWGTLNHFFKNTFLSLLIPLFPTTFYPTIPLFPATFYPSIPLFPTTFYPTIPLFPTTFSRFHISHCRVFTQPWYSSMCTLTHSHVRSCAHTRILDHSLV